MSDIVGRDEALVQIACRGCKHYYRDTPGFSCLAFDVIPREILSGKNMHTKPLPGQKNNVVFEPGES